MYVIKLKLKIIVYFCYIFNIFGIFDIFGIFIDFGLNDEVYAYFVLKF